MREQVYNRRNELLLGLAKELNPISVLSSFFNLGQIEVEDLLRKMDFVCYAYLSGELSIEYLQEISEVREDWKAHLLGEGFTGAEVSIIFNEV